MKAHRNLAVLFAALFAALAAPENALARPVVHPKASEAGATERYVLRVPNEREVATTRIEIHFPHSVRVISFAEVPGWSLQIFTDSAKHITGAVWTGSLGPRRFVEFPFVAVNPKSAVSLVWPTFQTYLSGERVDWIGHDDAKQPAAVTIVGAGPRASSGIVLALWVCLGAFALSIVGLVLALRPERTKGGFQNLA